MGVGRHRHTIQKTKPERSPSLPRIVVMIITDAHHHHHLSWSPGYECAAVVGRFIYIYSFGVDR